MNKKIIYGSIIVFIIDLISKIIVNTYLSSKITIINHFFYLDKVYNTGVSFGMFKNSQIIIVILTCIILFFLIKYIKSLKMNTRNTIACSLLFGGIIGNLFDRVFYGYVNDFLSFQFGNYYFPVFNIADISICIGMFLIILAIFLKEDTKEKK